MIVRSFIISFLICCLNAAAAIITGKKAMGKSPESFPNIVFGSMAIRYIVVSVVVFLCLSFVELNKLVFGLTFLFSTFVLIFFEIFFFNRMATKNKRK